MPVATTASTTLPSHIPTSPPGKSETRKSKSPLDSSLAYYPCLPLATIDSLKDTLKQFPRSTVTPGHDSGVGFLVLANPAKPNQGPVVIDTSYCAPGGQINPGPAVKKVTSVNVKNTLIDQARSLGGHCVVVNGLVDQKQQQQQSFAIELVGGRHVIVQINTKSLTPLLVRMAVAATHLVQEYVIGNKKLADTRILELEDGKALGETFVLAAAEMHAAYAQVASLYQDGEHLAETQLPGMVEEIIKKGMREAARVLEEYEDDKCESGSDSGSVLGDSKFGSESEDGDQEEVRHTSNLSTRLCRRQSQAAAEPDPDSDQRKGAVDSIHFTCKVCPKDYPSELALAMHKAVIHKDLGGGGSQPVRTCTSDSSTSLADASAASSAIHRCHECSKDLASALALAMHKTVVHKVDLSSNGGGSILLSSQVHGTHAFRSLSATGGNGNTSSVSAHSCPKGLPSALGLVKQKTDLYSGDSASSVYVYASDSCSSSATGGSQGRWSVHQCDQCSKDFPSALALAMHESVVHKSHLLSGGGASRADMYASADYGYASMAAGCKASSLLMHKCVQCSKDFASALALAMHNAVVHKSVQACQAPQLAQPVGSVTVQSESWQRGV